MLPFNYLEALYRRDNKGNPCVWFAKYNDNISWYDVWYGQVGKTITHTVITTHRSPTDAINTEFKEKRKKGYKYLAELKDNITLPVEEGLLEYLNAYLPINRTTADGSFLAMLAKTYDNENNKLFKKVTRYYGQYKINGLRCSVKPYLEGGIFNTIHLDFQSREGIHWNSLYNLEYYLVNTLGQDFLNFLIDNDWSLDGEIYLPGYSVNEINHFVKDANCPENHLLQFWCYDLIADDMPQRLRYEIMDEYLDKYCHIFYSKNEHLNNKVRLVTLPLSNIDNDSDAIKARDLYIDLGFEGLIMRNPIADYQFGKRNASMIKYKKSTDGKFKIVDIKPEGIKRPDIPLFICKNDINDSEFECHVGGSIDYQKSILKKKEEYIGKFMYVEYGERSGVNQLPFHVKTTYICK